LRPGTRIRWHALKPLLRKALSREDRLLDVGGFDGAISHRLTQLMNSLSVTVLDIDLGGLRISQQFGLNAVCGSVDHFPVREKSFDTVLCLDLIEHIEDEERLMREIQRILKVNGKLILSTPKSDGITFPFLNQNEIRRINFQWGHKRLGYSTETLTRLLQSNGFKIHSTGSYFNLVTRFCYRLTVLSKKKYPLRKQLFRLAVRFESWFKWGGQEHIIVAVKAVEPKTC